MVAMLDELFSMLGMAVSAVWLGRFGATGEVCSEGYEGAEERDDEFGLERDIFALLFGISRSGGIVVRSCPDSDVFSIGEVVVD